VGESWSRRCESVLELIAKAEESAGRTKAEEKAEAARI
jgi:hypothetical protein